MNKIYAETTKAQKHFLIQILFATSFTTLTGGPFLSGLAVYMGANDVLVSYISVITNLCGVFVLLFASLMSCSQSPRKLTIWLTILSRAATLSTVLIPAFLEKQWQLSVFVPLILAAFTLQGLALVSLNNWLAFYTPDKKRGQYISLRQTISLIVSVVFSLTAGRFLDSSADQYIGFVILFSVAFAASAAEILVLMRIDDTCIVKPAKEKVSANKIVSTSLKNKPFIRYVFLVLVFYLILYISDSFTFVFMFRYLELPYTTITMLQMLITLPQVFLLGIWGKISDKLGHKFVLNLSIWFFAGETFFLFLTASSNWIICIPAAFFIASIANSGFVISVFNRRYEIIPEQGRILYDSFFNAVIGIAFLLGPLLGGVLRSFILSGNLLEGTMEFPEIRLLYAVSTIGILFLQIIYLFADRKNKDEIIV